MVICYHELYAINAGKATTNKLLNKSTQTPVVPYTHKCKALAHASRLHLVAILLVELIPGSGEFLSHNIAQIHQVIEALLEGLESGS